jgi:Fic family protein
MRRRSAKTTATPADAKAVFRIEPTLLDEVPGDLNDVVAELAAASSRLGGSLNATTAASLADLVRIMNTYYSNLIEGHNTRPRDIERALAGKFAREQGRRNLQLEAAAHVSVQREIDRKGAASDLGEPASVEFVRGLHRAFYRDAPEAMLRIKSDSHSFLMTPGEWRSSAEEDNVVGRHIPPSSARVGEFMARFAEAYALGKLRQGARILAIPAAHHRFNYIHPFHDGNGRVSRLMSHAMGYLAGIDAHGLWSISRGLSRGPKSRAEYKTMLDRADAPREGDLDARGNLSRNALIEFTQWFLEVALDQVKFMSGLFEIPTLARRLKTFVERSEMLKTESAALLDAVLVRGEIERGAAAGITGLPERTARRVLNDTVSAGLLASATPKGPVSLRFPQNALEILFPRLYPQT